MLGLPRREQRASEGAEKVSEQAERASEGAERASGAGTEPKTKMKTKMEVVKNVVVP